MPLGILPHGEHLPTLPLWLPNNFPHYVGKIALVEAIRTLAGENLPENITTPVAGMSSDNIDTPEADIVGWKDLEWVSEYSK